MPKPDHRTVYFRRLLSRDEYSISGMKSVRNPIGPKDYRLFTFFADFATVGSNFPTASSHCRCGSPPTLRRSKAYATDGERPERRRKLAGTISVSDPDAGPSDFPALEEQSPGVRLPVGGSRQAAVDLGHPMRLQRRHGQVVNSMPPAAAQAAETSA
jgi:hypothetical protein